MALLLSEIIQNLVVRSGQFILGTVDLTQLGISVSDLWSVFQQDIEDYQRFFPLNKRFNITILPHLNTSNPYDFTQDINNSGYAAPTAPPLVTVQGTTGSTVYSYVVGAYTKGSLTSITVAAGTAIGPPALSSTDSILLQWNQIFGATSYKVYRINGLTTGVIADIQSGPYIPGSAPQVFSLVDQGQLGDGSPIPNTNGHVPVFISKTTPVGFRQVMTNWWMFKRQRGFPGQIGRVPVPRPVIPIYIAPTLYSSEPGKFDIEASYPYHILPVYGDDSTLIDVNIVQLEKTKILLDLLYGRFLQTIGNSRATFIHNDMPVITNGADMVEMGLKIYEDAKKEMYERQDWFKAIHP